MSASVLSPTKVYKELERVLKTCGIGLSVDKVLDIAKTITTLKVKLPVSGETLARTMLITPQHKSIAKLFDRGFWKKFSVAGIRTDGESKKGKNNNRCTDIRFLWG